MLSLKHSFFLGNVSSSFTPITHLKNARERVESLFICLLYECFKSLGSHFTSNGTHGQYFRRVSLITNCAEFIPSEKTKATN